MSELIKVCNTDIELKEYKGIRVVTFKDVDTVHQKTKDTANRNFNRNRKHFRDGEDFFQTDCPEAKKEFGITAPNGLTLITESGYLMLVKSFTDDLAWEVQRMLVNNYFRKPKVPAFGTLVNEMLGEFKPEDIIKAAQYNKIEGLKKELSKYESCYVDLSTTRDLWAKTKSLYLKKYEESKAEERRITELLDILKKEIDSLRGSLKVEKLIK